MKMFGKSIINMSFSGGPVTVSQSGTGGSAGPGTLGGGGNMVLHGKANSGAGGNITISGGVGGSGSTGNKNIAIGPSAGLNYGGAYIAQPDNEFTVFSGDSGEWMRWVHATQKAEFKLSDDWFVIKPEGMADRHPLDFGSAIDLTGKEDLNEIRLEYETLIKNIPRLRKLRKGYNELLEKHKLFDAIRGDDDAEI